MTAALAGATRDWLQRARCDTPAATLPDFTDLALDSRQVRPGTLFLALPGSRQHGREFIPAALAAGATGVAFDAAEAAPALPAGVVALPVAGLAARVGALADAFFASPSSRLRVLGITGTNGKTTVAWLVAEALEQLARPAAYVGTLGSGPIGRVVPGQLTTPDCVALHRELRRLADGARHSAVLEASSHALDQGRLDGVRLTSVAFTNLSRDHLDYHGSMERYGAAKARLFAREAGAAVINVGDAFGLELARRPMPGTAVLAVALGGDEAPPATLRGQVVAQDARGLTLEIWGDFGSGVLTAPLWGRFNGENLLVALGLLLAEGVPLARALPALAAAGPPAGRMERVASQRHGPAVLVDFAHTPDALAKALAAVRQHTRGRLWCVFGCGGERDMGKRPLMGAAAAAADRVIVTSDNPRSESPDAIIAAVVAGVPAGTAIDVVPDRAAAIRLAVRAAGPGDVVLIAGKGHETYQEVAGVRLPFADAAEARAALELRP